jgi:5-methylthioadenosine/S-adenosylhomocysteine deaminase
MTAPTSILIRNARLWPEPCAPVQERASVWIERGRIRRLGRFTARAEVTVDADGALCMPAFVHAHVHLCQTIFRNAAEDRALLPWLRDFIWPLEAAHDPASLRASALLSCAELIRGGTGAVFSMETVRHTAAVFEAVAETGLMGVLGHCLMDASGGYAPLAVPIDDALAECDVLLDRLGDDPALRLGIAPRFALACTEDTLREASTYARDRGLRLHTHASEQKAEVAEVVRRTGRHNIEFLHGVGMTGPDVGLAHCVHVLRREAGLLAESGTHVLHCPSANLKLASGMAPIPAYLDAGIPVGLGADGAACNNRLDMFAEMRLAGLIQKFRLGPEALPAREIVRMATQGGAAALGLENELGALREGWRANLILLDLDASQTLPWEDPATAVVYAADSRNVALTMVNGRILYENGALTTIDEPALRAEVRDQRRKLFRRAGLA